MILSNKKGVIIMAVVLMTLINLILICIIYHLLGHIEDDRVENDKYFDKIKRVYQIQIDELRDDIKIKDEIIKVLGGINSGKEE